MVANGGYDAAGIGGAKHGSAANIKISGGDITASGGSGAGIGSGLMMIVRIPDGIPPVLRLLAAPFKQLLAPVPVLAPVSRATMLILRSPAATSRPNQEAVQASALVIMPKRALRSEFPARIL